MSPLPGRTGTLSQRGFLTQLHRNYLTQWNLYACLYASCRWPKENSECSHENVRFVAISVLLPAVWLRRITRPHSSVRCHCTSRGYLSPEYCRSIPVHPGKNSMHYSGDHTFAITALIPPVMYGNSCVRDLVRSWLHLDRLIHICMSAKPWALLGKPACT